MSSLITSDSAWILRFDTDALPLKKMVFECVRDKFVPRDTGFHDLSQLHHFVESVRLSEVYGAIYNLFMSDSFTALYDRLCRAIVKEKFSGGAAYQRVPSARIQMPGQRSVNYHTDEWYGHGHDIQNFWLPLTNVSDTNSMFVSDPEASANATRAIREGRKSIFEMNDLAKSISSPLRMEFGQIYWFNDHIIHGTELNCTDRTRVSFDFRMQRDGDDRGLKDRSFFMKPGERGSEDKATAPKRGVVYVGKNAGLTKAISQKYQQLLSNRYAAENGIAAHIAETEMSGFAHYPALNNLISGNFVGTFDHLIMFSVLLLPPDPVERVSILSEIADRGLTLHFVVEDEIIESREMVEMGNRVYGIAAREALVS